MTLSTISGLERPQRIIAREQATQAALLGLHHAAALHYTEGPERWEGINQHKVSAEREYPTHADCSAFATWCLWNALHIPFGVKDVVNGQHWGAGYTGTMKTHGRQVLHVNNVIRADCVLYGPYDSPTHVAIVVGHTNGVPMIVSHGSESGPFLVPYNYRPDVGQVRRYV